MTLLRKFHSRSTRSIGGVGDPSTTTPLPSSASVANGAYSLFLNSSTLLFPNVVTVFCCCSSVALVFEKN